MKRLIFSLLVSFLILPCAAKGIPDNMYFKAMQHEMTRSLKKLHRKGLEKPFYIAYKLESIQELANAEASLGAIYPPVRRDKRLVAYAWVDIGTPKNDSLGYLHENYYTQYAYRPRREIDVAKSYEGIRQSLWHLTDEAYIFATETYQQKQAYKRTKSQEADKDLPDFVPQKQGHFVAETAILPVYDTEKLNTWVKELSDQGNQLPFAEQFFVSITATQQDVYYLNSLGGFYQLSRPAVEVYWRATLRNKDGFKQERTQTLWLADIDDNTYSLLQQKTAEFVQNLTRLYHAKAGQTYLGPVLLMPQAAGNFMQALFVDNMQHLNDLQSASQSQDPTVGRLRNQLNLRAVSNEVAIFDRPHLTTFNGFPLGGFMPVDDEGVLAQDLTLVQQGKIADFPRSSRPFKELVPSNGHARMTSSSFPRERLSNVMVEAKHPQSQQQLEEKLLQQCKELELEYCYILYDFPREADGPQEVKWAERIYTQDGRRELIYGLEVNGLTTRALRDIEAAGDEPSVTYSTSSAFNGVLPAQSIVTPALLVQEVELVPDNKKADKAPFVPKPR